MASSDSIPLTERFPKLHSDGLRYAMPVCLVAVTTAGCIFSKEVVSFPYLISFMAAVAISSLFGRGPAVVALLLAIVLSDFFLIPPIFSVTFDHITVLAAAYYAFAALLVFSLARVAIQKGLDQKLRLALVELFDGSTAARNVEKSEEGRFLGRLDGDSEGEIFGWALDTLDGSTAPKITVCVEGRPVGEVSAVHYRPDVGSHSFYFDLTRAYLAGTAAQVEAIFPNGWRLPNSPMMVNIPPARPVRHSEAVLFMHISKTAGTAFRDAIVENYRRSEVAYLYPDFPGFLCENLALLPLEQRARFRFVIGHFKHGIHQFLPQEWTYVTVVRDPVSRVISEFRYLLLSKHHKIAPVETGSPAYLVELLERRKTITLDNYMVRSFSGVSEEDFPPGHINREVFEAAVANLRTTFSFVGHQEKSDEAYRALQQRFHWKSGCLKIVNRGALSTGQDYEPVRRTIEHFNRWDCRLHAEICKLFP